MRVLVKGSNCVLLVLAVLVFGCASSRVVTVGTGVLLDAPARPLTVGIKVVGYRTSDGTEHSFRGTARRKGDQLEFVPSQAWGVGQERRLSLPVAEVESLDTEVASRPNPFAVAGVTIVVVGSLVYLGAIIGAGGFR